jgi:integrase
MQTEIFEQQTRGPVRAAASFAEAARDYMKDGGERRYLPRLLNYFGDIPIDQLDWQAIKQAARTLYPNASPATRNRQCYTPMSAVLKSAGTEFRFKRPKEPDGIVRWLTHGEASRLVAACAPHLRPLVMFLLYTGARAAEALWLDWRCVDLARAHVSFPKTKNGKPRCVALHRDLVAELANLPHRDGYVFRRRDGKALYAGARPQCVSRGQFRHGIPGRRTAGRIDEFPDTRLPPHVGDMVFCRASRLGCVERIGRLENRCHGHALRARQ